MEAGAIARKKSVKVSGITRVKRMKDKDKTLGGDGMVQVKEIHGKAELKAFVRFADKLYADNPHYVPTIVADEVATLSRDKNPAFEFCDARFFVAERDGKIVGRIMGIHNKAHDKKTGTVRLRFSRVDFVDDLEVSRALFAKVEEWAAQIRAEEVIGPMGFTDLDKEGMLVEGFDWDATFVTIYNAPYYQKHLELLGYVKDVDWTEFEIELPQTMDPRMENLSQMVLKRLDLHMFEAQSMKEYMPHIPAIFDVLNAAFEDLYGVVPLTPGVRDYYVKQFLSFVTPDFVPVVMDKNNRVVAVGITAPSIIRAVQKCKGRIFPFGIFGLLKEMKITDRIELYLVGVLPEYRGKGVNALLMGYVMRTCIARGIRYAETGPELETNYYVRAQWKNYKTIEHKRRRAYVKQL